MIIVTGGKGQLGQCLNKVLGNNAIYVDVDDCDITNLNSLKSFLEKNRPNIVINCAAYTQVDNCEQDVELSMKINEKGPENLAQLSRELNFSLLHISTDYVFDGNKNTPYNEEDKTTPTSIYGKGKLAGENAIINNSDNYIIIRTSWLYSEFSNNFVKNIKNLMTEREELGIVFDQVGCPTYAIDLANAISEIVKSDFKANSGIYHYGNLGVASWYDLTKEVQEYFNIKCDIRPIESLEYPTPAKRPAYSVLNTKKIRTTFNIQIPYWKESLKSCLQNL
jgi:dTDP-4-dehydrorhamnose reductase